MSVIARWRCEDHGDLDGRKAGPNGVPRCAYRGCTLPVERVEYVPADQLQGAVARAEDAERELRVFKAGLTDALRAHSVPATPTWAEAIHWLARHGEQVRVSDVEGGE